MRRAILIGLFLLGLLVAGSAQADSIYTNYGPGMTGVNLALGEEIVPGLNLSFPTNASVDPIWSVNSVSLWVNITADVTNLLATINGVSTNATVNKAGTLTFYEVVFNFAGLGVTLPSGGTGALYLAADQKTNWVYSTVGPLTANLDGNSVPAPAGLALLGLGSVGLAFIRRRKAQKAVKA